MNAAWTLRCQPDTAMIIRGLLNELIHIHDLEGVATLHQDQAGISRIAVWWEGVREKEFKLSLERARERTEMMAALSMGEQLTIENLFGK